MPKKQLDLVREGTTSVPVTRPYDPPLPTGDDKVFVNPLGWSKELPEGRKTFGIKGQPAQVIEVSYQVFTDPEMLRSIERKASENRSGTSVRGLARAEAGRKATVNLDPRVVQGLVRRAANNTNRSMTEGPVKVRVKWLEEPSGFPPTCYACKHTLAEHEVYQTQEPGAWTGERGTPERHWDPEGTQTRTYYLCPITEG